MRLLWGLVLLLAFVPQMVGDGYGTIPPAQGRILVIGDSLTSGLYADGEADSFAALVAAGLGMRLARIHATRLENAAEAWKTYRDWRPDVVVLEIGLNDVSGGVWAAESWRGAYLALVREIEASGAKVVACTTFWGGIREMHRNYQIYQQLNGDIRSVASERGVALADLWAATNGCEDCVSRSGDVSNWPPFHGDNFHPNSLGHQRIAQTILDALKGDRVYFPVVAGG
ncbi:MAG TPA: SGNH/GDSL hydrolase family protein [Nitrospira sp.]|nr:SGNH/GDSL hydrolase family protein [Nitrospira sp.]